MTRVLEFITALIIVFLLAVVVGIFMPSHGHIERSNMISKDIRDVYDVFNNFGRFKDYAVLRVFDPSLEYQLSGKAYGPGAKISWDSKVPKVGKGSLEIASATPGFAHISEQGSGQIVWNVTNDWSGHNKQFVIDMERAGRGKRLVKVTWSYDVDYGWNLLARYSNIYIHGTPDSVIRYSLDNVQTMLAAVPNIVYDDLNPKLVDTPQQPVLFVSMHAKLNQTEIDYAKATAMSELQAAMSKLKLSPTGPRIVISKSYGENSYDFDVGLPVSARTVTIDGQDYALTAPVQPSLNPAAASSAPASAASAASSAAPATAEVAKANGKDAKDNGPQPGTRDEYGDLIIDKNVRGMLAFGGRALMGVWNGSPSGIRFTSMKLQAYAATHGYDSDTINHPIYDKQMVAYQSQRADGSEVAYDEQTFNVYLPITNAPAETPEQEAAAAASSAPAPASSSAPAAAGSAAAASSAPAAAASAN